IIRVSVVATGIDKIAIEQGTPAVTPPIQAPSKSVETRLNELTQQLRANSNRLADRLQRGEPAAEAGPVTSIPSTATVIEPNAPVKGAVAPTAIEDVTIRPIPPKPTLFIEPTTEPVAPHEAPAEKAFIPPQPERSVARPRMPRIEDLPIPAQNEIRAKRAAAAGEADKPRMSLLQRLAQVGLGRREETAPPRPQAPRPVSRPQPTGERLPAYPAPRQDVRGPDPRGQDPVSEYAKRPPAPRPAPQGLDLHGRTAPVAGQLDDDQLEIPAFLRRQAN